MSKNWKQGYKEACYDDNHETGKSGDDRYTSYSFELKFLQLERDDMKNDTRLLLAIAGLGGLLYGVDFGVIAAAEPYMKALNIYTDAQISHIVGAVLLGGLLSSITAGWLCDFFGRKRMIVASAAMFLVAIPIVSMSLDSYFILYAGRVLQGMSAGYMAVVMPMLPLLYTLLPAKVQQGVVSLEFSKLSTRGRSMAAHCVRTVVKTVSELPSEHNETTPKV